MRILITGATGFVGSHLIEFLLRLKDEGDDLEIYGCRRRRSDMGNVQHVAAEVRWVELELTDPHSVQHAVEEVEPDVIHHLAGQTFVPTSFKAPQETLMVNGVGTVNLLEAVRRAEVDPVIHTCGTSEEYGLVHPDEVPVKETNPLRPLSPYGVSKVVEDLISQQYYRSYGIKTVITRAFNHEGPRRHEAFVTSNFAKQIVEIEKGLRPPVVRVGNLEAVRDYTDVRDIVKAYWLAAQKCNYGEPYNICSGRGWKIRDVLNTLLEISSGEAKVEVDPSRLRPSDVPLLVGDCTKFREKTGWKPEIPFEKTLEDLLEWWRGRIG